MLYYERGKLQHASSMGKRYIHFGKINPVIGSRIKIKYYITFFRHIIWVGYADENGVWMGVFLMFVYVHF